MSRNKELDGIRGIAILLVLVWHYYVVQVDVELGSPLAYFSRILSLAWSGVDLFFVLSGFLIVGILLDAKHSKSLFKVFYVRRACRILPLYSVVLLLFYAIPIFTTYENVWLFADPLPLLSYVTFTQNLFMVDDFGPHWLGVTWSLAIEEQFYILIPLLVWLLNRRPLFLLFIFVSLLAPICRAFTDDLGSYVLPYVRSDSILVGGCIAIVVRNQPLRKRLCDNFWIPLTLLVGLIMATPFFILNGAAFGSSMVHLWLAGLYGTFVLVSVLGQSKLMTRVLSCEFLVWFGLRSYGIYLLHQPISGIIQQYWNEVPYPVFSTATAVSLLVVLVLAELSFQYYEAMFIRIGKRYRYEKGKDNRPSTDTTTSVA